MMEASNDESFQTDHQESIHMYYSVVARGLDSSDAQVLPGWNNLGEKHITRLDQGDTGVKRSESGAGEAAPNEVAEICYTTWERLYFPSQEGTS